MKKLFSLIVFTSIAFTACEIENSMPGPMGPQGPAGEDGILGQVFEAQVDFTATNEFKVLIEFPNTVEVFESDVVMAYVWKGLDGDRDIWEPLPQTLFYNNSILLYGFDHTFKDINFFIDGNMNLGLLPADYTDGILFRVAIVPAAFAKSMNMKSIDEVMGTLKIESMGRIN